MDNDKSTSTQIFTNRVELLRKSLKAKGFDTESILALNRANRSGYKTKGKLPSFSTLESLAYNFNVNLNWLVLGRGQIFSDDNIENVAHEKKSSMDNKKFEDLEKQNEQLKQELIDALKEIIILYRKISSLEEKLTMLNCPSDGITTRHS